MIVEIASVVERTCFATPHIGRKTVGGLCLSYRKRVYFGVRQHIYVRRIRISRKYRIPAGIDRKPCRNRRVGLKMKKRLMALVLCLTVMMTMFAPLANATEEDLLSTPTPTPAPAAATVEPQAESAHESAAPTAAHTEQPSAHPAETVGQEVTAAPAETAASPVEEDVSGMIAVTAGSDVNLRTAPGRDSESLGKIAQSGTVVKPLKKVTLPGGEVWYAVEYEGCTGYIFGDLLTLSAAPAAAETPAAAATPETQETPETPAPVITEPDAVYTYEFSNTTSEVIYGYEATATLGQSVSVPRNGRVVLSGPAGQWQILVGGVWADLAGADSGVALTYALLKNAGSSTRIRCLDAAGNSQGESAVTLTDAVSVAAPAQEPVLKKTPLRAAAPAAVAADLNAGEGEQDTYNIVINYVFENNETAANSWTATIAKGTSISRTIESPAVTGYTPDKEKVELNVENISADQTITVTYYPAEVSFTIVHYQQNVANDGYTEKERETETGLTKTEVGANRAKNYDGFTALLYDTTTKIAADGSTVVEIYYDRNYYLLTLNLDGGYGADPVYARYGASISVANPQKPGYTFGGWNPAIPTTMPAENKTCTAQWNPGGVTYTVQYWQENANDTDYSYFERVEKQAQAGSKVSGSGDKTYAGFTFDHADANVVVKGDGSTVVNVYYKRNVYEVKFYNSKGTKEDTSKRITAKYGAFIGDGWPGNGWYVNKNDNSTAQSYLAIMPLGGKNFYGQQTGNYTATATYYVEVLPGENGTTTVGGTSYKVQHRDSAKCGYYGLSVTDEERYDIEGFTVNAAVSAKNGDTYNGAKFYYTRNQYELVFDDKYGTTVSEKLPFEQVLSESVNYKNSYQPGLPGTLEKDAYKFDGWYSDPGCTKPVDWTEKMPAAKVVVYAKWIPVKHTVKTFLTKDAMSGEPIHTWTVDHRDLIEKPQSPENGSYEFVGWFYEEDGVEKAFDFSMPITKDLNLYAKWSYNTSVEYTIKYAVKNADDTLTYIAEETKGSALAGTTKTFDAKTGTALYAGYQSGYFPEVSSHSLVMDINGNNEYTFIYVQKEKVPYTVKYLEKDTNKVLHEEKNAETSDAVITEKFEQITGYAPDAYQKRLVLSAEGNEIIFWYTKDTEHAPVQIIHWVQNIEGAGYTEYQSSTDLNGVINDQYSETNLTIPGFEYVKGTAVAGDNTQEFNAPATPSAVLTDKGLVLNLYYNRIEYPYEFRFVSRSTGEELAASVEGNARYQAQVTQNAKDIPGYTLVSAEQQAINIAIEDPANVAAKNVKTFYYVEQAVNISYVAVQPTDVTGNTVNPTLETLGAVTGNAQGSTATAAAGCVFVGWYKDATCLQPVDEAWVRGNKITPAKTMNYGQDENQQVVLGYEQATYYALFRQTKVTVKKEVTGNLGDQSKDFTFQWKILNADGSVNQESETFTLKHGAQKEILGIPEGATLVIQETNADGYTVTAKHGSDIVSVVSNSVTVNVTDGSMITFTNNKETVPDTGVLLDSLPYVVILAVVVLGAALVIVRRRKHRDDD